MNSDRHYLWLDLETTGLNPGKCSIIEFACILTDRNLKSLYSYHAYLKSLVEDWDEKARRMHEDNGLIDARQKLDLADCETNVAVSREVASVVEDIDSPVWLAGVGPHFDRRFIRRYMTSLDDALYYRQFDARTLFAAVQDATDYKFDLEEKRKHRAMKDIEQTIRNVMKIHQELSF